MARRKQEGLSDKHKKVLKILSQHTNRHGYPPTIREIQERAQLSSTSVANYYLERLEEKGFIERDEGVARGIRVIKTLTESIAAAGEKAKEKVDDLKEGIDELLTIPKVGKIVAGEPLPTPAPTTSFSTYDPEFDAINIAKSMLPPQDQSQSSLYALEVSGDSMIDAMVNDGDVVIMKEAQEAHNGEMVAVWLNDKDETTLKYFYLENGKVRLQPANPEMDPIIIEDPSTVEIQGKVVMVVRQLDLQ